MKYNKQQWLELFTEQQQSGLNIAAFCREKNIKPKYFYNRRSQYLKLASSTAFIQAKPPTAKVPDDAQTGLTLQCGSGRLHLPFGVSTVWLASLMKALA